MLDTASYLSLPTVKSGEIYRTMESTIICDCLFSYYIYFKSNAYSLLIIIPKNDIADQQCGFYCDLARDPFWHLRM